MYIDSFPINPTYIVAGSVAVYEEVWSDYKNTIQDVEEIASDISSYIRFTPSQTHRDAESGNYFQQSTRTSYGLSITSAGKINETIRDINNKAYDLISSAIHNYKGIFGIEETIKHAEPYNLLRYKEGEQYASHYDGGTESSRSVSVLIYMNDDYEGGEIEFTNFKTKIKPKAGTMILFPSNYAYSHVAHPVTSGTKYVIVTWLHDR